MPEFAPQQDRLDIMSTSDRQVVTTPDPSTPEWSRGCCRSMVLGAFEHSVRSFLPFLTGPHVDQRRLRSPLFIRPPEKCAASASMQMGRAL